MPSPNEDLVVVSSMLSSPNHLINHKIAQLNGTTGQLNMVKSFLIDGMDLFITMGASRFLTVHSN